MSASGGEVEGVVSEDPCAGGVGGVDCGEAVQQLYHYLDGELTDHRRAQIAAHLDDCRPCASAMEFEADLRQVIANRCRDRVPEALITKIATAIDMERQRPEDTERQRPEDTERQRPEETERQRPEDTERQRPEDTELQRPEETERQRPEDTERQRPIDMERQRPIDMERQRPATP